MADAMNWYKHQNQRARFLEGSVAEDWYTRVVGFQAAGAADSPFEDDLALPELSQKGLFAKVSALKRDLETVNAQLLSMGGDSAEGASGDNIPPEV